jgi:isopenicillin N synthase-like dioxygenase
MMSTQVPMFSLQALNDKQVRHKLGQCVTSLGFFYLSEDRCDHMLATEVAMQFFLHGSSKEKESLINRLPMIRRGYSALEAESTARVTNNGTYSDYSMSFSMGVDHNVFPSLEFRHAWCKYFHQLDTLAQIVGRAVLESVVVFPATEIDGILKGDPVLRLRYFPEVSEQRIAELEPLRMAPHYDLSIVTLIHQTPCLNGFVSLHAHVGDEIFPLPYLEGSILVMCGAVATILSDGRIVAPVHYVASPQQDQRVGSARTSSVFFLRPQPDFAFSVETARRCGLDVCVSGAKSTFSEWIGTNYVTMQNVES